MKQTLSRDFDLNMEIARIIVVTACVLFGLGCDTARRFEFQHLQNQGILALSSTNAYLGTNLLLAKEAQESKFLYNFLNDRGSPSAIEFNKEGHELIMYYPQDKEVYRADFHQGEWIIRGPFAITRTDYRALKSILANDSGEPVLELWGKKKRFKYKPGSIPPGVYTATIIPTPRPRPTPVRSPKVESKELEPSTSPMNFDQEALSLVPPRSERPATPDVLHKVSSPDEKWNEIVLWYTGTSNLTPVIKNVNRKTGEEPLKKGDVIRIPGEYVRKRTPFILKK